MRPLGASDPLSKGGRYMQAAANQVRWVPIGEIAEPWEESAEGEPDGAGAPAATSAPSNDKSAAEPIRPAALS